MGAEGLQWQLVDIRFDKGLDTRTQQKLVVPGKWTALSNMTLSKDYTLQRRDGYQKLAAATTLNGLATYNNELLTVSGGNVSSVSTAITDGTFPGTAFAATGELGFVRVSKTEVYRSSSTQTKLDCATMSSAISAYVWNDLSASSGLGIKITIIDNATGVHLLNGAVVTSAAVALYPRIVAVSSPSAVFYVVWVEAGQIMCRVYGISTTGGASAVTAGTITQLFASGSIGKSIDLVAATAGNGALLAYAFGNNVNAMQITHTGTTPTNVTTFIAVNNGANAVYGVGCAVNTTTGGLIMSWGAAGLAAATISMFPATWVVGATATLATYTAPGGMGGYNSVAGCWDPSASVWRICTDYTEAALNPGLPVQPLRLTTTNSALAAIVTTTICNSNSFQGQAGGRPCGPNGPWIGGKPFYPGAANVLLPIFVTDVNLGYVNSSTSNNATQGLQSGFYLIDVITGAVVSKANYGSYNFANFINAPVTYPTPCSVPGIAANRFFLLTGEILSLQIANSYNVSPSGICRLDLNINNSVLNSATSPIHSQLAQETFFAGGVLSTYDGRQIVEHAFLQFPEGSSCDVSAGAGMTAGSHQVVFVYEWVDNAGQRHQSAPSIPQSPGLTVSSTNLRITCKVPTLQLTQKSDVYIVAYMTQANGLTFYRVTSYSGSIQPGGVANAKTATAVQFDIRSPDTDISGNELLYSQPFQSTSTLPNNPPPPCNALTVHQNRLVIDVADTPFAWRFSQTVTSSPIGAIGLQFNEQLGGTVPAVSGGIVAFSSMDEKLIILCSRKLYVVYGTGPDSSGANSNYSDPQEIPSDVGCSSRHSILRMPNGVIFKSLKGWYLLGRDLTVKYIGAGVAQFDSNSVSSATLLEDREECRFGSITGTQLTYCYSVDQWAVDVSGSNYPVSDATWWPALGRYVRCAMTNCMVSDTTGLTTDTDTGGTQPIPIQARLSFLHLQSLGGFQRARWLYITASAPSTPTSTLAIGVDYDDGYNRAQTGSYAVIVPFSGISFPNPMSIDLRHRLRRQKCKNISFTFLESGLSADTFLNGIQALSLQVGLKKGTNKLPAAQGVG